MSQGSLTRHEELSQFEVRDTGEPISKARNDIMVAARYCRFYGGAADKLRSEQIPT